MSLWACERRGLGAFPVLSIRIGDASVKQCSLSHLDEARFSTEDLSVPCANMDMVRAQIARMPKTARGEQFGHGVHGVAMEGRDALRGAHQALQLGRGGRREISFTLTARAW